MLVEEDPVRSDSYAKLIKTTEPFNIDLIPHYVVSHHFCVNGPITI